MYFPISVCRAFMARQWECPPKIDGEVTFVSWCYGKILRCLSRFVNSGVLAAGVRLIRVSFISQHITLTSTLAMVYPA